MSIFRKLISMRIRRVLLVSLMLLAMVVCSFPVTHGSCQSHDHHRHAGDVVIEATQANYSGAPLTITLQTEGPYANIKRVK